MSGNDTRPAIGPYAFTRYDDPAEIVRPWEPRGPEVAARLVALLTAAFPTGAAGHIGSTAIPGCDGKGVIDLMLVHPDGQLAAARDAVDGLGFSGSTPLEPSATSGRSGSGRSPTMATSSGSTSISSPTPTRTSPGNGTSAIRCGPTRR